ncbi:hypothetical protein PV08_09463 [Exophiala spinifera]|uniref:Major facilitator superfamily (MFS) profile domain-containing protein n=1 Tax=Exophiala spinifera TaxID=91928 RepID=A0A0D1ZGU7_9EURO|nr:uncharacterized protein PV08_09463 [Exophiala spinifera]KIW12187.1 hypothetical protein PV08_09463 [Exophiala spinifera]
MAPSNSVELGEQRSPVGGETGTSRDYNDDETVAVDDLEISALPPSMRLSNGGKARVIAGNALLQLPIWGFPMTYGLFQDFYTSSWPLSGSPSGTGVIGTTSNGIIYLCMPFLFAALSQRWAHLRRRVSYLGIALATLSFILSSVSTRSWHLVATQGVLAALGSALLYSPTTLSLGESFTIDSRALAYGVIYSSKNIVGSTCPFLLRGLLDAYGFRNTMRIWTAIVTFTSVAAMLLLPQDTLSTQPAVPIGHRHHHTTRSSHSATTTAGTTTTTSFNSEHQHHQQQQEAEEEEEETSRPRASHAPRPPRRTSWHFLSYRTFHIYIVATMLQSSGYGIPQTYVNSYAHSEARLSATSATLLLTLFNVPGILSSAFFGWLSDNRFRPLSATATTALSSVTSALSVWLLWGLAPARGRGGGGSNMAILSLFSVVFGFFASGYSSTFGGVCKQLEREAAERNQALDSGVVFGMLNGARGVGYVVGGVAGVSLLSVGEKALDGGGGGLSGGRAAYGTEYGPLIVFTGLTIIFGGWSVAWKIFNRRVFNLMFKCFKS